MWGVGGWMTTHTQGGGGALRTSGRRLRCSALNPRLSPCSVGDVVELTSKQGKQLIKRDVHVFDESLKGVDLTLWGESARNMNGKPGEVIAVK